MSPVPIESPIADAPSRDARGPAAQGGRLHLFLGMAPGVGKTQAMLQAAMLRQSKGVSVLAGGVETHGQPEIELLVANFQALPNGLDQVLRLNPMLVLMDDLARANPPNSRHPKRYQDVLELLDSGFDVYATLNVSHIQSQIQAVRHICDFADPESVPDTVVDRAQEIQLVDITVEDWLSRQAEGKIRNDSGLPTPEKVLPALRELALRYTTEWVNRRLESGHRARRTSGSSTHDARLMVSVGPSPYAEGLIRWTCSLAAKLDCPWLAVSVQGSRSAPNQVQERIARHLHLARKLGGEALSTAGDEISDTLLRVARERSVSQIIVGRSDIPPIWRQSITDRLIQEAGAMEICVVRPNAATAPLRSAPVVARPALGTIVAQYAWAILLPLAVAGACWRIVPFTGYMFVGMALLLAVVLAALRLRRGPILVMATVSVLSWDYFFIPPSLSLRIEKFEDVIVCGTFYVVALSMLAALLRHRELAERRRQQQAAALLQVTQSAALSLDQERGLAEALRTINFILCAETALVVRRPDALLADAAHPASTFLPVPHEWEAVRWSFEHRQPAGRFTQTMPGSNATWYPLETATSIMGAFGVKMATHARMDFSARQTIEAFALQLALVLEKESAIQALRQAEMAEASERLRRTLLDSVSHELKTPLAALQAATDGLEREPNRPQRYLPELRTALRRLRRTVDNLLDMTRLESGAVKPVFDWCEIAELCDAALDLTADALADHLLERDVPEDLPMAFLDQALMEQALANLLLNAAMHTPPGSSVKIRARVQDHTLTISVQDRGPGLPEGDPEALFKKFARGAHAPCGGSGLGLAIARGLPKPMEEPLRPAPAKAAEQNLP